MSDFPTEHSEQYILNQVFDESTNTLKTGGTSVTPGTGATNLGKAEDAPHASGDTGIAAWAVRADSVAATANDGDYSPIFTDGSGRLWVNAGVVTPGTGATNLGKAEDAAHTSGDVGIMELGVRNDALSLLSSADGDYTPKTVDKTGRQVILPFASADARTTGTATTTGTSDTSLVAASGSASLKTYITDIQVANTGNSTSLITFKDGSGGSTLAYTIAPAGGGSNIHLSSPIATSANTAFHFAAGTASTTIYVSAQGYKAP